MTSRRSDTNAIRGRRSLGPGLRISRPQRFRRSCSNASTSLRRSGHRPTRFVPRVVSGRKAGYGTGSVKGGGWNGAIGGSREMKMFPGFPILFPARSWSCPVESWCSRRSASPAKITVGATPSYFPYVQPPGTLGTFGTALRRHALGPNIQWNKSGNVRNDHACHAAGIGAEWMAAQQRMAPIFA